jgi:molybdopterin-guanine dinucleotide biosynthesis protein A
MLGQLSLAILAGGMGRRFGGSDKQAATAGGMALGRRVALNALGSSLPVFIVGPRRKIYDGLPLRFVRDIVPGYGPLSGLHAALSAVSTPWLYLLACDMPFFSMDWLCHLAGLIECQAAEKSAKPLAVLAKKGSYIEPFQGLYSRLLIPELEKKMDSAGVVGKKLSFSGLLEGIPHMLVPEAAARDFSPDWNLFSSINDPDALELYSGKSFRGG